MNLRKSRGKDGKLKIYKLSDFELHQVISALESLPSTLLNKCYTKPIILYTGCSINTTGFIDDFMEGTIVWLYHPHLMDVIGPSLEVTHKVNLQCELIND